MIDTNVAPKQVSKIIQHWLLIGVVMVFIQVVIGGITRLTDSGLSITEWKVIQGTIPPLNEADWNIAFEKYKVAAKKQYETLHAGMTLSEFKVIFFWEYLHRLWARTMGFVFLFPFLYFWFTKQMPGWLMRRLGITIALATSVAVFGWVMVASGLNNDDRTWVSAYKLIIHLILAAVLFGYLLWTWFLARQPLVTDQHLGQYRKLAWWIVAVLLLQIVFGGLMAGMRAGLVHPYFPLFVEGQRFLQLFTNTTNSLNVENFIDYEPSLYIKGIVQVLHRSTAYLLTAMIFYFCYHIHKRSKSNQLHRGNIMLISMLIIQFLLGILTIINCFGRIPVLYGSLHQAGALLLFAALLYATYQVRKV